MIDLTASVERIERLEKIVADLQGENAARFSHASMLSKQVARITYEIACFKDDYWRHSSQVNHGFGPEPPLTRILECAVGGYYEVLIPPGADVRIIHVSHEGSGPSAGPTTTPTPGDDSNG